jgi:hypothetical protein
MDIPIKLTYYAAITITVTKDPEAGHEVISSIVDGRLFEMPGHEATYIPPGLCDPFIRSLNGASTSTTGYVRCPIGP